MSWFRTLRDRLRAPPDDSTAPGVIDPTVAAIDEMLSRVRALAGEAPQRVGEFARGGMATIETVDDPSIGRRAAMKVLHAKLKKRADVVACFIREAHVTGQLDHPNIVPVHELGVREDGLPYFTMKLVEGETLFDAVSALPAEALDHARLFDLLQVVVKVCDALDLAHSRGVLHCDVKPQNVVIGRFGEVFLMDWGIARLTEARGEHAEPGRRVVTWVDMPPPEGVSGTVPFMAPEQIAEGAIDERTDVLGVGTLLYFTLARQAPFAGASVYDAVRRVLEDDRPTVSEAAPGWVPPELERIVDRAMAHDPDARYPSVKALREDLVRFMRGGGEFPVVKIRAGQHVVRMGEDGDAAYVIIKGRCEVYAESAGRRRSLKILSDGDVFGETAILAAGGRTASVVALEDTSLMKIARDIFEEEVDRMKPWMGAFTRALARRFREQLERGRQVDERPHAEIAQAALMALVTWGEPDAEGRPALPRQALLDRLAALLRVGASRIDATLAELPGLSVEPERVILDDRAALERAGRAP